MVITDFTNIIATIGGSTIISSTLTYFFAKRKYSSEVDSNEIDNLRKTISVYNEIIDDLKERISDIKQEVEDLEEQLKTAKKEIANR